MALGKPGIAAHVGWRSLQQLWHCRMLEMQTPRDLSRPNHMTAQVGRLHVSVLSAEELLHDTVGHGNAASPFESPAAKSALCWSELSMSSLHALIRWLARWMYGPNVPEIVVPALWGAGRCLTLC